MLTIRPCAQITKASAGGRSIRAGCGRTRPRFRRLGIELLESRQVLSGMTLLTHGHGGVVTDWVDAMRETMANRPEIAGGESTTYTLSVSRGAGGALNTTVSPPSGADPLTSASGEIFVLLDWSDPASALLSVPSTVEVASAVLPVLLDDDAFGSLSVPIVETPIHLLGHSRGGSLVGEIARLLGEYGVWVDHVTTLDPHPVDGVREPFPFFNWGDARMSAWENVVFWDNYWRTEQIFGALSYDFTGEAIAGAHNLQLDETLLETSGYAIEHSDTHLFYHGTIDLSPTANDGSQDVPESFYGGLHPARQDTGFRFGRIASGQRPGDGLGSAFGGTAVRQQVPLTQSAWPNVGAVDLQGVTSLQIGEMLPIGFLYQDADTAVNLEFWLDNDSNPRNGNAGVRLVQAELPATAGVMQQILQGDTSGATPGEYYVTGQISDDVATRFAVASQRILLQADTDLRLFAPSPGSAAETNTFTVEGATPGERVRFFAGLSAGSVPLPGCADSVVEINNPILIGAGIADASGIASTEVFVPASLAGSTRLFQAVERSTCTVSNLETHTFTSPAAGMPHGLLTSRADPESATLWQSDSPHRSGASGRMQGEVQDPPMLAASTVNKRLRDSTVPIMRHDTNQPGIEDSLYADRWDELEMLLESLAVELLSNAV